MALIPMRNYIFFDSKDAIGTSAQGMTIWDRAISAEQYAQYNEAFFTSGVNLNVGGMFEIKAGNGLKVVRESGHAMLGGRSTYDPKEREFAVSAGDYYFVMESNTEIEYRDIREGLIPVSELTFPLLRDINHYQIVLAKIEIPAGAVQVNPDTMITDYRYNPDYCGLLSLNANIHPTQLIVTADDVTDTDTHMIPVKTGSREKSLRGDGSYSADLTDNTLGNYKLLYDSATDTMRIVHKNAAQLNFNKIPISYQLISGSNSTNLNNMLSGTDGSSYGYIASTNGNPAIIVFKYYDVLPSFELAGNIDIAVKIKHATSDNNIPSPFYCVIYDLDTGTVISGTQSNLNGSATIKTETFNFHFNSINVKNIGLYVYGVRTGSTTSTIRIYGSELNITYDVPYKTLMKIDPNKVTAYDYTNGTAAVMGMQMQSIAETPLEGQNEQATVTFSEHYEDAPPHGTTPETALPYVKSVYMAGEYMIYDGKIYKCVEDNAVNPPSVAAVAHKWELIEDAN